MEEMYITAGTLPLWEDELEVLYVLTLQTEWNRVNDVSVYLDTRGVFFIGS